jgi:hypothetical protein
VSVNAIESDDPDGQYANAGRALDGLLTAGKLDTLDATLARLQASQRLLSDGRWSLDAAQNFLAYVDTESERGVFTDLMQWMRGSTADKAWSTRLTLLRNWRETNPGSVAASVCIARLYLNYAWHARGGNWAEEVSDAAGKLFFTRARLAADALRGVESRAEECLSWFPVSLITIKAQERGIGEWHAVFERGAKACPNFWHLYTAGADFHLQRWSGSVAQMADYLGRAVALSQATSGRAVAARIAWSLLDGYGDNVVAELREQNWTLIRGGFEDWLHAYPRNSVANYFLFATKCFDDKSAAKRLIVSSDIKPYDAVWNTHLGEQLGGFSGVRAWASA